MLPPVRCFTCGKVVCHLHDQHRRLMQQGMTAQQAMDALGLRRECCRVAVRVAIDAFDQYHNPFLPQFLSAQVQRVPAVISTSCGDDPE